MKRPIPASTLLHSYDRLSHDRAIVRHLIGKRAGHERADTRNRAVPESKSVVRPFPGCRDADRLPPRSLGFRECSSRPAPGGRERRGGPVGGGAVRPGLGLGRAGGARGGGGGVRPGARRSGRSRVPGSRSASATPPTWTRSCWRRCSARTGWAGRRWARSSGRALRPTRCGPGPVLAALTEQAVADAASLTDDQLAGAMHAAGREKARDAWKETTLVAEYARRRAAQLAGAKAAGVPEGRRPGRVPRRRARGRAAR